MATHPQNRQYRRHRQYLLPSSHLCVLGGHRRIIAGPDWRIARAQLEVSLNNAVVNLFMKPSYGARLEFQPIDGFPVAVRRELRAVLNDIDDTLTESIPNNP